MIDPDQHPTRILAVLPSWIGDAVMVTPALRLLREYMPGAFIGGLMRPGIDDLLAGLPIIDDVHVDRASGMMGPKRVAARVRPRRYQAALLFTNSFSTALVTRIAGIPERIGYARDGRAFLLTNKLMAPRRKDTPPYNNSSTDPNAWAPIPAVSYYANLVRHFLNTLSMSPADEGALELVCTQHDHDAAEAVLKQALSNHNNSTNKASLIVLNPGGNNPAKRWPTERFAALADYLAKHHNATVAISGSPGERELIADIAARCASETNAVDLAAAGLTIPALKSILAQARLLITNDTGPRHIAAAFGTPVITLFGPTDHRWTTIPHKDEITLLADPSLPAAEVANDHPDRCDVSNIGLGDVVAAANKLLAAQSTLNTTSGD